MSQQYLDKMRDISDNILNYIENEYADNTDSEAIINYLQNQKIDKERVDLKLFLHLISKIADNHHRGPGFFDRIDRILNSFKTQILKNFTNFQIFDIFKDNKRTLYFLLKEKFITPDENIASVITNGKYLRFNYPEYFYPEFKNFYSKELIEKVENKKIQDETLLEMINNNYELFEQKRKTGENDDFISEIIRKDSSNIFISHVNQTNCLVTSNLNESIFETNSFLLEKNISLIEYAAFSGSLEIMKYLFHQSIVLSPNLWQLSIHGQNSELIHLLEENSIKPNSELYNQSFYEAIKCFHNDLAIYIENNFIQSNQLDEIQILSHGINSFNFAFFNTDIEFNSDLFYDLCNNGYYFYVKSIINNSNIDINSKRIS